MADLPLSYFELKGTASITGGVELGAVGQSPCVVHSDCLTLSRERCPVAWFEDRLCDAHS